MYISNYIDYLEKGKHCSFLKIIYIDYLKKRKHCFFSTIFDFPIN